MRPLKISGRFAVLLALAALVAACQQAPITRYPIPSFADKGAFRLNVARVEVVKEYQAPMAEPNIDHDVPVPPIAAMQAWINDRLVAVGDVGVARVIIRDASMIDTRLPVKDMFTKEQSNRYQLTMEMDVELWNGRGFRNGYVTARATRSRSIVEASSDRDRDQLWYDMVKDSMTDLDAQLDASIKEYFPPFMM